MSLSARAALRASGFPDTRAVPQSALRAFYLLAQEPEARLPHGAMRISDRPADEDYIAGSSCVQAPGVRATAPSVWLTGGDKAPNTKRDGSYVERRILRR